MSVDDRVTELQQEVAKTLLADAPEGWEQLGCRFTVVGGYGSLNAFAVVNGDKERIRAAMVGSHGLDLQEAMYTPEKGTWWSMTCSVEPTRAYHFTFNYYDKPVEFGEGEPVLDESWERELRQFPRPWALIPDWNPVKQKYSDQEWAAEVERFNREGHH